MARAKIIDLVHSALEMSVTASLAARIANGEPTLAAWDITCNALEDVVAAWQGALDTAEKLYESADLAE